MFNPEFYPTPAEVIEIMLQGEEIEEPAKDWRKHPELEHLLS